MKTELEKKQNELADWLKICIKYSSTKDKRLKGLKKLESEIAALKQQGEEEIYYECTKCKWRMTKVEYFSVKEDFGCPKCQTTFHKFKRIIKGVPVSVEEIRHKLIVNSFEYEDCDGTKHSPWITLEDAMNILQEYAQQGEVTDEMIKTWAKKYVSETEHYFHSTKDLIIGAKAHRDNLI